MQCLAAKFNTDNKFEKLTVGGSNLFEFFTQNVYTRFFPDSKVSGLYSFFDHFESDSSCSCSVKRQMNRILKHPGFVESENFCSGVNVVLNLHTSYQNYSLYFREIL